MHRHGRHPMPGRWPRRQRGVTLVASLLMLVAVLLLAAASASTALMGEKAARAGRDRQVALQAAEDALMDAERDLDEAEGARADLLAAPAFGPDGASGCGSGAALGLCASAAAGEPPPWQSVDLPAGTGVVPFGHFTGADMETGAGFAPLQRPRYIVERLPYHRPGDEAGAPPRYYYRVTAIGFGSREATQVVLQTAYRRPED